jgi:hypothetical protein
VLSARGIAPFDSPYFQFLSIFFAISWFAEHIWIIYNWGVSCRIRSPKLCCGDHPDSDVWESESLSPRKSWCGLTPGAADLCAP